MTTNIRPLAIVTGASTGIGFELARRCAAEGFDLILAADEPAIQQAAEDCRRSSVNVEAVEADLATAAGVNGTKAFINSFSHALRNELAGSGVTVTCLMPGATETEFFERANMMDTKVGREKDRPADVAQVGFDAMMQGEGDVVSGWSNKLQAAVANVTPAARLAEQHRKKAEPGGADRKA